MTVEEERQFWDTAAKDPDVDNRYICNLPTKTCLKAVGELDGKVLEIGCGVGRLLPPGQYGVDISKNMLEIAKQRRPDCHLFLTDGRTLPFEDGFFDTVYSMLVFQHLDAEAFEGYIKETHRVLKDSGRFRFQFIEGNENKPWSHHYSLDKVSSWLKDFDIKSIDRGLVHFHWTWITAVNK